MFIACRSYLQGDSTKSRGFTLLEGCQVLYHTGRTRSVDGAAAAAGVVGISVAPKALQHF
jgi:hypothetical protein